MSCMTHRVEVYQYDTHVCTVYTRFPKTMAHILSKEFVPATVVVHTLDHHEMQNHLCDTWPTAERKQPCTEKP